MKLKEYFKELSIVVLGIVIALWVNNLGMNSNNRKTQKQVLQTVLNETQSNSVNVDSLLINIDWLSSQFSKLKEKEGFAVIDIDYFYFGLILKNSSYEAAKYTGILSGLDYNQLSILVSVYESHNLLGSMDKSLIDIFLSLPKVKVNNNQINYMLFYLNAYKGFLLDLRAQQAELIKSLEKSLN